ncbi:protein unc-93 homolog A [Aplysia californica]|nr:protein unc-93 homolog A [Aplysia californica]
MILPMLMYSFMEVGFVTSEMTKAFVTCPLGMHMVGYTMMFLGICGSLSSYISGLLTKCTGRIPLILWAAGMNLGVLVAMDVWAPTTDSLVPFFAIMGLWGASDGIWVSQSNSLMSVVFPDKFEEAFAGLRMAQGIGVATVFGSSPAMSMRSKIYMLGGLCIFGIIMYLIMEILLRREKKKRPITIRQTSV